MGNRYMIVYYHQQADGKYTELTEFKDSLKGKTKSKATVVLDFKKKRVVKNGLNKEANFDTMLDMYKRLLGDQLTPYLP